jgi:hypothetical protein
MPTYRHFFGVAVVDDILYAIGGATSFRTTREGYFSITEQYIPLGYTGILPPVTPMDPSAPSESLGSVSLPSAPLESSDLLSKLDSPTNEIGANLFTLMAVVGLTTIMAVTLIMGLAVKKRNK